MRLPGRSRAAIFLGDAGSMFLGFALTWFAISLSQGPERVLNPAAALWFIMVPIMDAVAMMLRRIVKGRLRHGTPTARGGANDEFLCLEVGGVSGRVGRACALKVCMQLRARGCGEAHPGPERELGTVAVLCLADRAGSEGGEIGDGPLSVPAAGSGIAESATEDLRNFDCERVGLDLRRAASAERGSPANRHFTPSVVGGSYRGLWTVRGAGGHEWPA
jgi:hypothetical protein